MYKRQGQIEDRTTGLSFYNARYFDPTIGRFVSPDTIIPDPSDGQDFNRYTYVRNNPINLNDPTGNCPTWCGADDAEIFAPLYGEGPADYLDPITSVPEVAFEGLLEFFVDDVGGAIASVPGNASFTAEFLYGKYVGQPVQSTIETTDACLTFSFLSCGVGTAGLTAEIITRGKLCLLYTSPSPRD